MPFTILLATLFVSAETLSADLRMLPIFGIENVNPHFLFSSGGFVDNLFLQR